MEKKQVLFLLFLVLAVSLASFTLGVMVGRRGAAAPIAQDVAPAPARIPVDTTTAAPPPPATEGPMQERPGENLTFYDALPKGDQPPLGSGINLPPKEQSAEAPAEKPAPSAAPAQASAPAAAKKPAPAQVAAPAVAPPPPAAEAPKASAGGAYVVQVASFPNAADAQGLKERLGKKGYAAFTQDADLGAKGLWYRVYVGPFDDAAAAGKAVERLAAEDKLKALVRKR